MLARHLVDTSVVVLMCPVCEPTNIDPREFRLWTNNHAESLPDHFFDAFYVTFGLYYWPLSEWDEGYLVDISKRLAWAVRHNGRHPLEGRGYVKSVPSIDRNSGMMPRPWSYHTASVVIVSNITVLFACFSRSPEDIRVGTLRRGFNVNG